MVRIEVELSVDQNGIEATVPEEKVLELQSMLRDMLQGNVIAKKVLRTVIGKTVSFASAIYCWRPFMQELFVAMYS